MEVIWSEIVTQIIGFLLAVWLLNKFAWKPILGLLDERRRKIEDSLRSIEEQRREVEALKTQYEQELRNIEAKARERIQQAIHEANEAAARIREQTQEERRQRLQRAEEEVARLVDSMKEELRQRTVQLAILAAEKVIRERLDDESHRRLIRRFIEEVEAAS
jgi:F-type H+-transporting ATPase subunit b